MRRYAVAAMLVVPFVACAGKKERKALVSVDSRSGGRGGVGSGGSGGTKPMHASSGGSGNAETEAGAAGSGALGGNDRSGAGAAAGAGGEAANGDAARSVDDCTRDADCPGGHCILLSVGFRTCQTPPVEASACSPNPSQDDCCQTADCNAGFECFSSRAFNYSGPEYQAEFNVCTEDECSGDTDCLNNEICVPKGTLGRPVAFCISALCHADSDCSDYPDGRCTPMIDECNGGYWAFACAYPGPGSCKTNADCSHDTPPFGPGDSYCALGTCTDLISGTHCD